MENLLCRRKYFFFVWKNIHFILYLTFFFSIMLLLYFQLFSTRKKWFITITISNNSPPNQKQVRSRKDKGNIRQRQVKDGLDIKRKTLINLEKECIHKGDSKSESGDGSTVSMPYEVFWQTEHGTNKENFRKFLGFWRHTQTTDIFSQSRNKKYQTKNLLRYRFKAQILKHTNYRLLTVKSLFVLMYAKKKF